MLKLRQIFNFNQEKHRPQPNLLTSSLKEPIKDNIFFDEVNCEKPFSFMKTNCDSIEDSFFHKNTIKRNKRLRTNLFIVHIDLGSMLDIASS